MACVCPCSLLVMCPQVRVRRSAVQAGARKRGRILCTGQPIASGTEGHDDIPQLEPFSQSRLSRSMRERSFLQKTEDALNDKCMALDGEAAYQCWEALFEYENIKEDAEAECSVAQPEDRENACRPLERLENMVRQSGGVNSLIDNVRMVSKIKEAKKKKETKSSEDDWLKAVSAAGGEVDELTTRQEFLEDGGIPESPKETQEDIDSPTQDSLFTRILTHRGHIGFTE